MFQCSKCQQEFPDEQKLGRRLVCKPCFLAQQRDYKVRNREKVDAGNAAYREQNRERINAWRRNNRDKINPAQVAWRNNNWDRVRETKNRWHRQRMKIDPTYAAKVWASNHDIRWRRREITETPLSRYFADEIAAFYGNCPDGYQVDHIAPLLGQKACGLHVPWNLQYLPPRDNQRKNSKEE
jgi:hypothetical protein